MKTVFYHGILAGLLAAIASDVYNNVYSMALVVDFSKVVNVGGIVGASIFGCVLASLGEHFFSKWVKSNTAVWFNALFLMLTFASCVGPFSAILPMDMASPELFPGLTIPMHFFPILFWLAMKPLFEKNNLTA